MWDGITFITSQLSPLELQPPGFSLLGLQPPSGRWSPGRGSSGRWSSGRGSSGRWSSGRTVFECVLTYLEQFASEGWPSWPSTGKRLKSIISSLFLFLQAVKTVTQIFEISQSLGTSMIMLFLLEPVLKSPILEGFFCVLVRSYENVALHLD